MSEIIRLEEAAYELRVSIRTLERMAKRGDIDIIRIGRLRRVRRADVDAIIEGRANVALPISQYDRERNATSGRYK